MAAAHSIEKSQPENKMRYKCGLQEKLCQRKRAGGKIKLSNFLRKTGPQICEPSISPIVPRKKTSNQTCKKIFWNFFCRNPFAHEHALKKFEPETLRKSNTRNRKTLAGQLVTPSTCQSETLFAHLGGVGGFLLATISILVICVRLLHLRLRL